LFRHGRGKERDRQGEGKRDEKETLDLLREREREGPLLERWSYQRTKPCSDGER
jgi:hypothetical protein